MSRSIWALAQVRTLAQPGQGWREDLVASREQQRPQPPGKGAYDAEMKALGRTARTELVELGAVAAPPEVAPTPVWPTVGTGPSASPRTSPSAWLPRTRVGSSTSPFDEAGRPVEICEHIMPGDRWQLAYEWAAG